MRLLAVDEAGRPVVRVDSLVLRPVSAGQLRAARAGVQQCAVRGGLGPARHRPADGGGRWAVLAGPGARRGSRAGRGRDQRARTRQRPGTGRRSAGGWPGGRARGQPERGGGGGCLPEAVAVHAPRPGADGAREAVHQALELVQAWLAEDALASSVLVIITQARGGGGRGRRPRAGPGRGGGVRAGAVGAVGEPRPARAGRCGRRRRPRGGRWPRCRAVASQRWPSAAGCCTGGGWSRADARRGRAVAAGCGRGRDAGRHPPRPGHRRGRAAGARARCGSGSGRPG